MKKRMLEENTQSYEKLLEFRNLMKQLLEETLIPQLLMMQNNPQSINSEELDEIEQRLEGMKVRFIEIKLIPISSSSLRKKLNCWNNWIYNLILLMWK